MKILVTGGAGYIGSHTCVELLENGYEVVIVDNLYNASREAISRVETLTGKKITFYQVDLLDQKALNHVFDQENIDAVIHFAGLKAVGESVSKPVAYYHNNLTGTLHLVDCMNAHNVKNIIFSSSATVYGEPESVPVTETCPKGSPTNPYGRNGCWSRSLPTFTPLIHNGTSSFCVISIRSAHTKAAASEKIQKGSPTISFLMWHR